MAEHKINKRTATQADLEERPEEKKSSKTSRIDTDASWPTLPTRETKEHLAEVKKVVDDFTERYRLLKLATPSRRDREEYFSRVQQRRWLIAAHKMAEAHGGEYLSPSVPKYNYSVMWKCAESHIWEDTFRRVIGGNFWCRECPELSRVENERVWMLFKNTYHPTPEESFRMIQEETARVFRQYLDVWSEYKKKFNHQGRARDDIYADLLVGVEEEKSRLGFFRGNDRRPLRFETNEKTLTSIAASARLP